MKLLRWQIPGPVAALMILAGSAILSLVFIGAVQVHGVRTAVTEASAAEPLVLLTTSDGSQCSGFRVAPQYVLSAAHCFTESDPDGVMVTFSPTNQGLEGWYSGPICSARRVFFAPEFSFSEYQPQWDYALVALDQCALNSPTLSVFKLRAYTPGEPLISLGYPGDTPYYSLYSSEGHEVRNIVDMIHPQPLPVITTNLKAVEGNSGGVVTSSDELEAVGITILSRGDGASHVLTFDQVRLDMIRSWMQEPIF